MDDFTGLYSCLILVEWAVREGDSHWFFVLVSLQNGKKRTGSFLHDKKGLDGISRLEDACFYILIDRIGPGNLSEVCWRLWFTIPCLMVWAFHNSSDIYQGLHWHWSVGLFQRKKTPLVPGWSVNLVRTQEELPISIASILNLSRFGAPGHLE